MVEQFTSSHLTVCLAFMCVKRFSEDFRGSEAEPSLVEVNQMNNSDKALERSEKDSQIIGVFQQYIYSAL